MSRIKVPGDMPIDAYGRMYYALDKRDVLCLVGADAPERVLKRYRFDLTDDEIERHQLQELTRDEEIHND